MKESNQKNQNFPPLKRIETDSMLADRKNVPTARMLVEDQTTLSVTLGCHFKPNLDMQVCVCVSINNKQKVRCQE